MNDLEGKVKLSNVEAFVNYLTNPGACCEVGNPGVLTYV